MRVGIVAQRGNERAATLGAELYDFVDDWGATPRLDRSTAGALEGDRTETDAFEDCQLVVSIGGDGTFLYAARRSETTPVLGVNLGEVGFLNAVPPDRAIETVRTELERFERTGAVRSRPVDRLRATTEDAAPVWPIGPAMNEVLVQAPERGPGRGVDLAVRIDGSAFLETRGDGMIVATPTGSTAYNLSAGGPLVHPGADALLVIGMCTATQRPPLVVGEDSEIEVAVSDANEVLVIADGTVHREAAPVTVSVGRHPEPARVAGPQSEFFEALGKLA